MVNDTPKKRSFIFLLLVVCLMSSCCVLGFTINKSNVVRTNDKKAVNIPTSLTMNNPLFDHNQRKGYSFSTSLKAEEKESSSSGLLDDYEKRGNVFFAIVMLTIVWIFSIPPEFRRAHFCSTKEVRYDCVSFGEWTSAIGDYYKGGGGVHFDFSIEKKF